MGKISLIPGGERANPAPNYHVLLSQIMAPGSDMGRNKGEQRGSVRRRGRRCRGSVGELALLAPYHRDARRSVPDAVREAGAVGARDGAHERPVHTSRPRSGA